ncbi:MAG: ElaA protein [Desulforhopalus sp.]|jgi:ElaA protein
MTTHWKLRTFEQLSTIELYTILQLRQGVFVLEQNCPYLDCDNKDQRAHHLLGSLTESPVEELAAYLRIIIPLAPEDVPHIGRVVCHPKVRGKGLGKKLVEKGISHCNMLFPGKPIKISAQQHLVNFYTDLGFRVCSAPYDEDGITHIEMIYTNAPEDLALGS